MIKQINCPHYIKESKKTSVYTYKLIGAEINLCNSCERKLRAEIIEQDKQEKEIGELSKTHKWLKSNKLNGEKNATRRTSK
jgi:hypothetical protein